MVTTEWAVPHAAGKFVRNLAGAESDGAWTVVRADLCKGLESGVYVNIDEVQVRRMFDSERTLWYSCYAISPELIEDSMVSIARQISARRGHAIENMVSVVSGRADLLGIAMLKALHGSMKKAMAPERWTFGVVHESEMDAQLRLSLLVEFSCD